MVCYGLIFYDEWVCLRELGLVGRNLRWSQVHPNHGRFEIGDFFGFCLLNLGQWGYSVLEKGFGTLGGDVWRCMVGIGKRMVRFVWIGLFIWFFGVFFFLFFVVEYF